MRYRCSGECLLEQGSASVWCSPPVIDMQFLTKLGLNSIAAGGFYARTAVLERRAAAILQGAARLEALINGSNEGSVVFDPAPLATVTMAVQQAQGIVDALEIPESRRPCVGPALQAAVAALADTAVAAQASLEAQQAFVAFVVNGV